MPTTEKEFFRAKRPWSRIKDRTLGSYSVPYFTKVSKLGQWIVVVDAFAGPGVFEDGSKGSPVILCDAAEQRVPQQYRAIFGNRDVGHHTRLKTELAPLIEAKKVQAIHGRADDLLGQLDASMAKLGQATLLVYLDPFGLKGCEFEALKPFLGRDQTASTEIIMNVSVPTIYRLSGRKALSEGRSSPQISKLQDLLSRVLGGDYWRDFMLAAEPNVDGVMRIYRQQLASYLPWVGACPVQEDEFSGVKYYMTFCSGHSDAMVLMNDIMFDAYHGYMKEAWAEAFPLLAELDWPPRPVAELEKIVLDIVAARGKIGRSPLWLEIVREHFMRFHSREFRQVVQRLVRDNPPRLAFHDVKGTGKLNDLSVLYPIEASILH